MANYPPKIFFDDLTKRDNTKAPAADLYVAGFPCQPFSVSGLQQGFADKAGRGTIFWKVREYIAMKKPKVFVLENVRGLKHIDGGKYFEAILASLNALGCYNIHHDVDASSALGHTVVPRVQHLMVNVVAAQGVQRCQDCLEVFATVDVLEPSYVLQHEDFWLLHGDVLPNFPEDGASPCLVRKPLLKARDRKRLAR